MATAALHLIPEAHIFPAGQAHPFSNDSSVATSGLIKIFQTTGVADEAQELVAAKIARTPRAPMPGALDSCRLRMTIPTSGTRGETFSSPLPSASLLPIAAVKNKTDLPRDEGKDANKEGRPLPCSQQKDKNGDARSQRAQK